MKKILFVIPSFEIGGTTVSTRNLISLLDCSRYEYKVLTLYNKGTLSSLYEDVGQVNPDLISYALSIPSWKEEKSLKCYAIAIIRFLCNHIPQIKKLLVRHSIRKIGLDCKFDIVVASEEGLATYYASLIQAPQKVAWVRCDYKRYFLSRGSKEECFYDVYNRIVCVSEATLANFIEIYPEYKEKSLCIYNAQNSEMIKKRAQENIIDESFVTDRFVILSVGRLNSVKRFDLIPSIAKDLQHRGLDFYWYIIGDGEEREKILCNLKNNNVEDRVIMLGAKSNPHYYINHANLYVCLSSSEACPRVVNEAKILKTPVVSTDFSTIYEYITDGENGIITTIEHVADNIERMMKDDKLRHKIENNICKFEFDNTQILEKIRTIL